MGKILYTQFTIFYIVLLQYLCEGLRVPARIKASEVISIEENQDKLELSRHHHHNRIHNLDICHCHKEICDCCVKIWKYRICETIKLVENYNDTNDLAVDFEVVVNNKSVFTDVVSLKELPSFCYKIDGFNVCVKLEVRDEKVHKQHNVRVCAQLQLRLNSEVLAHFNVLCLTIERKTKTDEGGSEAIESRLKQVAEAI